MRSQSYLFQVLEVFVFKSGFGLIFQAHGLSAEGTTKKLIQEASIMFLYGEYEGLGLGFMFTKNGRPRDVGSTQVPRYPGTHWTYTHRRNSLVSHHQHQHCSQDLSLNIYCIALQCVISFILTTVAFCFNYFQRCRNCTQGGTDSRCWTFCESSSCWCRRRRRSRRRREYFYTRRENSLVSNISTQ